MAAAEARAVWQRTANRYFIQEDAKRAPKLAYCPSNSSLLSKVDTKPDNSTYINDSFALLDDKSLYPYPSCDSKWWLQSQPDYIHQRGLSLTNEKVNALEGQNSRQFVENQDGSSISSMSKESYDFIEMDSVELPWWQVTEKDDKFASIVANKSHNSIESNVLGKPMHTSTISNPQMTKSGQNGISRVPEIDSSKSKILEALCHSQTRAREAENAAKKAHEEKEHVIKLLFRQASQLFAYRQWVYLLQLENLCYQVKNNNSNPISSKSGKLHKNLKKAIPLKGKITRNKCTYERNIRKYAVVFVVGLGIVGAGLFFGWTVGWMLI